MTQLNVDQNVQTYRLRIQGMTCAGCASRLQKALENLPGVHRVAVNFATERASITAEDLSDQALCEAISEAGFSAKVHHFQSATQQTPVPWFRKDLTAVLFALVCSAPLVLPMIAMLWGVHWMPDARIQFVLATLVQFGVGLRFYRAGFKALFAGYGNMDLLVALGTSAAYGLSIYKAFVLGSVATELYFEASTMVISLVLLGKWFETRAKHRATEALREIEALQPDLCHAVSGDQIVDVPTDSVLPGELILVKPFERVPLDGLLHSDFAQLDESHLNGESQYQDKERGSMVLSGSLNTDFAIKVCVTQVRSETSLARFMDRIEAAQTSRAPVEQLVDRVASVFVPLVVLVAIATFLAWFFGFDASLDQAVIYAVSVLVVACPCALGLATPTALVVASGFAAKRGVVIKDIQVLQALHRVRVVCFDKTGTLTEGKPKLSFTEVYQEVPERRVLGIAAALQQQSEHVLAKALLDHVRVAGIEPLKAEAVQSVPGQGVSGTVEGKQYTVGGARLLEAMNLPLPVARDSVSTLSYLVQLGGLGSAQVMACFQYSDEIRPHVRQAVQALARQGIESVIVSGDRQSAATHVAKVLSIPTVYADVMPEEKESIVQSLRKRLGRRAAVAMVGDGVNDAVALAVADVGIAMGDGTDVAVKSAGVTLSNSNVLAIPMIFSLSKKTWRIVQQNLFWAFAYNVVCIPLAAMGFLSPVFAGAAMALSSVSVVSNSLRLRSGG